MNGLDLTRVAEMFKYFQFFIIFFWVASTLIWTFMLTGLQENCT